MSTVMDCLLNQIVAPYVSIAANLTTPLNCPVPLNCEVDNKKRFLNVMEGRDENAAPKAFPVHATIDYSLAMPKMVQMFEERRRLHNGTHDDDDGHVDDAQFCVDQMAMNTVAHNMTYAANKFMECTASAGLARLEDPATTESDGAFSFHFLAMVAAATLSAVAIAL
jgi:hypothetical protein